MIFGHSHFFPPPLPHSRIKVTALIIRAEVSNFSKAQAGSTSPAPSELEDSKVSELDSPSAGAPSP